jgi:hypothetical protein
MARSGETFAKRQREKARQEKQAAKRARRLEKDDEETTQDDGPDLDALMEEFRIINEAHAAGELESEEFEERRDKILLQLGVE